MRIDELAIPSSAMGAAASDFVEMVDIRNRIEADILGSDALAVTAEELLPVDPAPLLLYTFNAEENRHMLAVNDLLGFRGVGAEAAWKREAS